MSKGDRRERQAVELLEQTAAYRPYRPATVQFGENDLYNLFDILAVATDRHNRLIQVKSNRASGIKNWQDETEFFREAEFITEYWVPYDNQGWRVIQCTDTDRVDRVDEREHTGIEMGSLVVEYLGGSDE